MYVDMYIIHMYNCLFIYIMHGECAKIQTYLYGMNHAYKCRKLPVHKLRGRKRSWFSWIFYWTVKVFPNNFVSLLAYLCKKIHGQNYLILLHKVNWRSQQWRSAWCLLGKALYTSLGFTIKAAAPHQPYLQTCHYYSSMPAITITCEIYSHYHKTNSNMPINMQIELFSFFSTPKPITPNKPQKFFSNVTFVSTT